MAINQGVRQGPPTSADISPPPPPLPRVANPKHHLLSSFGCFRSQITKRVEPQSPEDLTRLFPPSACKPWYGSQGMWKTFFRQHVSWRDRTHSSAAAQRARLCKWEMTVLLCVEYQWSNYCFMLGYWPLRRRAHAANVLHFSPASSQGRDEHCALESRANNGSTDTGLEEPRGPEPQTAKRWGGLKRAPQQRWND